MLSLGCRSPNTSTTLPSVIPRRTLTHSAVPLFIRITKMCSVVVWMAVAGTKRVSPLRWTGHCTSAYIPDVSLIPVFVTSYSTGMVRVSESTALLFAADRYGTAATKRRRCSYILRTLKSLFGVEFCPKATASDGAGRFSSRCFRLVNRNLITREWTQPSHRHFYAEAIVISCMFIKRFALIFYATMFNSRKAVIIDL